MENSGVEKGEAVLKNSSLLDNLLAEESKIRVKYRTPIDNTEEARKDAIDYAGYKIGWHRVASYFYTEEDPAIDDYTDWDLTLEETMNGDWNSMKKLLHRYAEDSRKPGVEDEESARAFDNLADSL